MKHYNFGSIEQFRNVVKYITEATKKKFFTLVN